ncbi:MAG: OmpA family protein [Gemmatimonadales bacterium]
MTASFGRCLAVAAALTSVSLISPVRLSAQIGGFVRGAVNDQVQKKINNAVSCAFNDTDCIRKAQKDGKPVTVTDANGKKVSTADSAKAMNGAAASNTTGGAGDSSAASVPGQGAWLNYDFVPGDKVLFYDDFADDHVGDLPTHEDVTDGNVTVVDIKGQKYFRTTTGAYFWITLPEALPDQFTIEAVWHGPEANPLRFRIGADGDKSVDVWCYPASAGVSGEGANGDKNSHEDATGIDEKGFSNCRFMFNRGYVKSYINDQRLGQLNGLVFSRTSKIQVEVPNVSADNGGALLTDIRIAEGGKPLYDALTDSGHVSTHGILFATGSAKLEGESTPTLTEIGDMLKAHPDLKLTIEGHTDNTGSAAGNLTLSQQRADAVAKYLESNFQIDASRLAAKGYGDTKPAASNDTPEGRQQNRRVELVKMP